MRFLGSESRPSTRAVIAAFVAAMLMAATGCGGDGGSSGAPMDQSSVSTAAASSATAPVPTPTYVPPPILPNRTATVSGTTGAVIPAGFLRLEEKVGTPLGQEGVHYVQDEGADLPPLLAPCGAAVSMSPSMAIDGRQIVLVSPMLWKSGRLTVYRDAEAAKQVIAAHRDALQRCPRHEDGSSRTMIWETRDLEIGDEAIFIGGQQYIGQTPISVHYRGVFTRQGRAVFFQLDLGRSTVPPSVHEVEGHRTLAAEMVERLRGEAWAR